MQELLDRYAGVLLDVYGVLLDGSGVLPGARELIAELDRRGKPFAIVTNDASRSIATYEKKLAGLGLPIAGEHIVTSGSLLPGYFATKSLAGARVCVLGTADSADYVRTGGGEIVAVEQGMDFDVLAVCDDAGVVVWATIEWALSAVIRAVEAGRRPALVLPNPDLVYPKSARELGFTAGAMALLIETALARRFPHERLVFDHLGKPEPHLFAQGAKKLGLQPDQLVMVGDQLETDVAGARAAGCDVALLDGVSRWYGHAAPGTDHNTDHGTDHHTELSTDERFDNARRRALAPTWLLDKLWP